jgi:hypothetical protein
VELVGRSTPLTLQLTLPTDRMLALGTTKTRDVFLRDLRSAQAAARAGIVSSRAAANDRSWKIWADFRRDLLVDPWLTGTADPILLLAYHAFGLSLICFCHSDVRERLAQIWKAVNQLLPASQRNV